MDVDLLLGPVARALRSVDEKEVLELVAALCDAPAVHLGGCGRSAFLVRGLATRLSELGQRTYVLGDASTPALRSGDLVVLCSGSGRAPSLLVAAEHALRLGGRVALVTAAVLSPIGRIAHHRVHLPPVLPGFSAAGGSAIQTEPQDEPGLVYSLRVLFEQTAFLFFESLMPALLERTGQSFRDLEARRANLEL